MACCTINTRNENWNWNYQFSCGNRSQNHSLCKLYSQGIAIWLLNMNVWAPWCVCSAKTGWFECWKRLRAHDTSQHCEWKRRSSLCTDWHNSTRSQQLLKLCSDQCFNLLMPDVLSLCLTYSLNPSFDFDLKPLALESSHSFRRILVELCCVLCLHTKLKYHSMDW